jgi:hypothetical protein
MVWTVGAVFMIIFGVGVVAIGVSLPMYEYAIFGGILVVGGIALVVALKRGPITSHLLDG